MRARLSRAVIMTLASCLPGLAFSQTVDQLVARNVAARGGSSAWRAVTSLRMTGKMDVGRGMQAPYTLEQKRPRKMRLEFLFDGQTAIQCLDGKSGWKVVPFRGHAKPEPLTAAEMREAADSADLDGLLFDYAARGHVVSFLGREQVNGRDTYKLKVALPGGAVRWVYLDTETALEVKVDAVRRLGSSERRVETFYEDWRSEGGVLIPRRYEIRTEGTKESQTLTVDTVKVNPPLDDSRFVMGDEAPSGRGSAR